LKVDFVLLKAGGQPAEVFELGEAPLDLIALLV
jgi:hypothetical protein